MISWLERIQPNLNHLWRGGWKSRALEPARYLYDHELVLVLRGTCRIEIGKRIFELEAGHWIIIPPATNHLSAAGRAGAFRTCLHFDWLPFRATRPSTVCSFYPQRPRPAWVVKAPAFVPGGIFQGNFALDGPLPGLLETIFHSWRNRDALSRRLGRIQFLEVLTRLLMPGGEIPKREESGERIAYGAKELLESETGAQEGIQNQLESLGFTYAHVCRLFHKTFGLTPGEYRNAVRLERAKALLRNPRLTVAQVAYKAGFEDPTYFTRLFRRQNGVPPTIFRQT